MQREQNPIRKSLIRKIRKKNKEAVAVLSFEQKDVSSLDEFLSIYGSPRPTTNQWGHKGDLMVGSEVNYVFVQCDKCHNLFGQTVHSLKRYVYSRKTKLWDFHKPIYCHNCSMIVTSIRLHGTPHYRNREKIIQTNLKRYGIVGTPRKGIKQPPRTDEWRRKISVASKKRLSDSRNHPMFGKKMSEESRKQMIESNSKTWRDKILRGDLPNWHKSKFYSEKLGKIIYCRSSYEKTFYNLLESNTDVIWYSVEGLAIPYEYKGITHYYTPDVQVLLDSGIKHLIEIKAVNFMKKPVNLKKFKAGRKWVTENNYDNFIVLNLGDFWRYMFKYADKGIDFTLMYKCIQGIKHHYKKAV